MGHRGRNELWAFMAGLLAGGIVAILYAPAKGEDTRKKIRETAEDACRKGEEFYEKGVTGAEKVYHTGKGKVEKIYSDGRAKVEETIGNIRGKVCREDETSAGTGTKS
jgi:gas vesicle protein